MTTRSRRRLAGACVRAAIVLACSAAIIFGKPLSARVDNTIESGVFRLFKFEQAIGDEHYEIREGAGGETLTSSFTFTDRGTPVALNTTFEFSPDLTPRHFTIKGRTARISTVDAEVTIDRGVATIREGAATRTEGVSPGAFTLAGYAPPSMQMTLMRFWATHGHPGSLPLLPRGAAQIEHRGRDVVEIDGHLAPLERYSVRGVIWGRETLWCDEAGRLAALVGVDAEFDHFEAAREELAAEVPKLVARAAQDGMAAMAEIAAAEAPPANDTIAIAGARIVDMTGRPPIASGTVVVSAGHITAVGPSPKIRIPPGATVVNGAGKTVIPGLWDMHAHFEQVEWGPIYLASGVTTVRDVGNELEFIEAVRDAIRSGAGLGPRLLLAGVIDGPGPKGLGVVRAATPDEGRQQVDRYHAAGFDQIKIYSSIARDVLRAIVQEAHALGMTVTGHVPNGMTALQAIDDGLDQINHREYISAVMKPNRDLAIAALKRHHTVIDPTLALYELLARPLNQPIASFEPGVLKVAPELLAPLAGFGLPPEAASREREENEEGLAQIRLLHRAGIPIVAGTDQSVPGYSLHREIELYVKAGFSPLEAMQAATIVSARAMKQDDENGTIERGKRGDLVILDADPLIDIRNTRRVHRIVTNGRVFDPAPLWQSVGFQP